MIVLSIKNPTNLIFFISYVEKINSFRSFIFRCSISCGNKIIFLNWTLKCTFGYCPTWLYALISSFGNFLTIKHYCVMAVFEIRRYNFEICELLQLRSQIFCKSSKPGDSWLSFHFRISMIKKNKNDSYAANLLCYIALTPKTPHQKNVNAYEN